MSKKTILKRAAQPVVEAEKPTSGTGSATAEAGQNRARRAKSGAGAVGAIDVDEFASKVADALWARFSWPLLVFARLAAADTVHTAERPETVMRHAVKEAELARKVIEEVCHG